MIIERWVYYSLSFHLEKNLMCHVNTGKSWDRPIFLTDQQSIWEYYSKLQGKVVPEDFVMAVFTAITDYNSPQPIVLVTIVDLYYRYLNGLRGIYPWVSLPFSALNYETGVRLMAPMMESFHGVFAMFSLAQRNLQLLRLALGHYGVDFITFHDCGCFMPDRDEDIMNTEFYKNVNLVRSHFEALGGEVEVVPFEAQEWQSPDLDMGLCEQRSYIRMIECLESLDFAGKLMHSSSIQSAKENLPFVNFAKN